MLRLLSLAASLVVLAGCSSSPPAADQTPATTFTTVADPDVVLAPALTDTMHLFDAPHVTGMAPAGSQVIRVPVLATGMPVSIDGPTDPTRWEMPRPAALTFLTGSATLWVDVQGTVTNANPTDPCFWRIQLYATSEAAGSNSGVVGMDNSFVCVSEPAVVPAGARALEVVFPGYDITASNGVELALTIVADGGVLAPGATIDVLTGTPEYDSRVTVSGLQLPLTTQTLLV